jgi:hypothetical protein
MARASHGGGRPPSSLPLMLDQLEQPKSVNEPRPEADDEQGPQIELRRVAWGITTVVFLLAALILLVGRRYGYAEVTFAVAVAAAINLI